MLLLEANRVVPVDRLVDAVWDEAPPSTARSQIQICVSALRKALADADGTDAILTRPPGYLFQVGDGELDLHDFERMATLGKAALAGRRFTEAADCFAQALALWDGPPFEGLNSRVLEAAATLLTERYLATVEEYFEIQLTLGKHHELIGELKVLTATYPLRERLRAQLMTALYRDGRQTEALEVYRETRQALVEELGLEPGTTLQSLERAILTGDASLGSSSAWQPGDEGTVGSYTPPRMLPWDISDFTGRDELVHEIKQVLRRDQQPQSSLTIVALSGKGGVGKTALAIHAGHELAEGFPDGQIYVSLRSGDLRPRNPAEVLQRFLRALGVPGSSIPEGLDERAEMYRSRLAGRRILVILDDAAAEKQVLPLLPAGGAVIVTSRLRLTALPGAHLFEIRTLGAPQAASFLEQVVGQARLAAEPDATQALLDLCDGLPLALRIVAARLAARPHWTVAQLMARLSNEHRRLDELTHGGVGIRTSIAVAYDSLSDDGRRLFRRLSLLVTPDFGKWVAIALLDVTSQEYAEDLLDSLVDIQLVDVERVGSVPARYRFHELIRVYAREQLLACEPAHERSAALQRVMKAWLSLAREAHRREYGGDFTVLHGPSEGWPLPPGLVEELLISPLAWYETERAAVAAAVRQSADSGLHDIAWDLAMAAVTLFEAHSHLDDWRETHEIALSAARRAGNRLGQAAMLYSLGALYLSEGRLDQAAASLSQALEMFDELGERHGSGLARRNLAFIDRVRGDYDQALARYEDALASLRAVGDTVGEAHALISTAQIRVEVGKYEEAEALLDTALEIARRAGNRRVEAQALHRLGESWAARGDLDRARGAFGLVLAIAGKQKSSAAEAYALHGLGIVHLKAGEFHQAEPVLGQAQRLATRSGDRLLSAQLLLDLGCLCSETGRHAEAARYLAEARGRFEGMGAKPGRARAEEILRMCAAAASD